MRNRILSVALTATIFASTLTVLAQEQASAPAYKDGDSWQFNIKETGVLGSSSNALVGLNDVVYVNGKFKIVSAKGGESENDELSDGQAFGFLNLMFGRGNTYGGQHLAFPLSIGQKWELESTFRPRGARKDVTEHVYSEVKAIEEVAVPAGTFTTFKIVREQVRGPSDRKFTYYYSPETKCLVKAVFELGGGGSREIELVKVNTTK